MVEWSPPGGKNECAAATAAAVVAEEAAEDGVFDSWATAPGGGDWSVCLDQSGGSR